MWVSQSSLRLRAVTVHEGLDRRQTVASTREGIPSLSSDGGDEKTPSMCLMSALAVRKDEDGGSMKIRVLCWQIETAGQHRMRIFETAITQQNRVQQTDQQGHGFRWILELFLFGWNPDTLRWKTCQTIAVSSFAEARECAQRRNKMRSNAFAQGNYGVV